MKAFNSFVAAAAEFPSTATRSRSTVSWRATDPTYAVNPTQIDRQSQARSSTACRRCSTGVAPSRTGRMVELNFDAYNSMRIAEMPKGRVDHHADRRHRTVGRPSRADDLRRGAAVLNDPTSPRPASAFARSR